MTNGPLSAPGRHVLPFLVVGLIAGACVRGVPGPPVLEIQISDLGADRYRISAPDSVRAGTVKVQFTNMGKIPHDAQLFRVDGDHSQAEVAATISAGEAPTPEWLHAEGGVGTLSGGRSANATVHLIAGAYFISDTGLDEDSVAFAKAGAIRSLVVSGPSDGLPPATATIAASEYAFDIPALHSGATTVRFENLGAQTHQFFAAPLLAGKTLADVRASFEGDGQSQGPAPMDFTRAVSAARLDPARSLVMTLDLKAGRYAFVCVLRDRAGGPRHLSLGMISEVNVE